MIFSSKLHGKGSVSASGSVRPVKALTALLQLRTWHYTSINLRLPP